MGIEIRFFSNDHQPIHIHAIYGDQIMKVLIYRNADNKITTIKYKTSSFNQAKLKQLKEFVSQKKEATMYAWEQFYTGKKELKTVVITKKVK